MSSILSTTLTILCLMAAPQPEVEPFYDHLTSHKMVNNQQNYASFLAPLSNRLKPSLVYDYTPSIMDNANARVDFDSLEHLPLELREYLVNEAHVNKQVILEIYNLNTCGLKANQLIELFPFSEGKITIAIDSGRYLRIMNPEGLLKETDHADSKSIPENLIASVWSVLDDLDTNERVVSLHLFFSDDKGIEKWLDRYIHPSVEPQKVDPLFVIPRQESDRFVSMGLAPLPFRPYKCLDYPQEPLHPSRHTYCAIEEVQQCDQFIESILMPNTKRIPVRYEALTYALDQVEHKEGLYLEFGVSDGGTISHIANQRPSIWIHGFDSFVGLVEEWNAVPPGQFGNFGRTPVVPKNVMLHKGFFEETLPFFNKSMPADMPIAFMHIDSDLYSSAKAIFKHLGHRIVSGTIIVFDDFLYNKCWIEQEPLAFGEFLKENDLTFEFISYTGAYELTVRIK